MRILSLLAATLLLAACSNTGPRFNTMSEAELYAYNVDKPLREQVYCYERRETRSHIPRRHCATVQELIRERDLQRTASQLNVLQPATINSGVLGL